MNNLSEVINNYEKVYWIYLGNSCYLDDLERFIFKYNNGNAENKIISLAKCKLKFKNLTSTETELYNNLITLIIRLIYLHKKNKKTLFISTNVNLNCISLLILERIIKIKIINIVHNQISFNSSVGFLKPLYEKFLTFCFWRFSKTRGVCSKRVYEEQIKTDKNLTFRKTIFVGFPKKEKSPINHNEKRVGKIFGTLVWGRQTPYKSIEHVRLFAQFCEYEKINMNIFILSKINNKNDQLKSFLGKYVNLISIDCYADMTTINYFRKITDFEFFPYLDISQSGPIRLAMERDRRLIIPHIALSQCEEAGYENFIEYKINEKGKLTIDNFKKQI